MYEATEEEFEEAIRAGMDAIPERFLDDLENVAFIAEDEPEDGSELLGLYDGVALTERGNGYGAVSDWPDTITVYKGPHERMCASRGEFFEEVRKTVVHEVGHYFGMDEDQIADMGYA